MIAPAERKAFSSQCTWDLRHGAVNVQSNAILI